MPSSDIRLYIPCKIVRTGVRDYVSQKDYDAFMQQQDDRVPLNYRKTTSATAGRLVGGLYTTATEVLPGFSQSNAAGTQTLRALRAGASQAEVQRMAIAGPFFCQFFCVILYR